MIGEMHIGGRKCRLFGSERPACILVQPSARHENATLEAEAAQIAAQAPVPFVLSTVELEDWIVDPRRRCSTSSWNWFRSCSNASAPCR